MAKPQMDKLLTGLAGEFLVAGHLCLRGYVASLTLKNYPGVDIFCLNPANGKQVAIQVKTLRGGKSYYVPEKVDEAENPFIFVYIRPDDTVDFFVVPAKDVAEISARERNEYLEQHPNVRKDQPRMVSVRNLDKFNNRWELLGLD
mgnify:FL=1